MACRLLKVLIMRLVALFTGPPEDLWEVIKVVGGIIIFVKLVKLAKSAPYVSTGSERYNKMYMTDMMHHNDRNSWSTTVGATPEVMRSDYHSGPFPTDGEGA